MTPLIVLQAFAVWLVNIAAEMVHGILRGLLLVPLVGDLPARQIGVPVGSLLVFAAAYLCVRWIAARTKFQLLGVGLLWVALTVLFEVGLGRFVLGFPLDRIAEDYNPPSGGFLGLGLLFLAVSPLLAAKFRGRKSPLTSSPP